MKIIYMLIAIVFIPGLSVAAPPTGDTQGKVSAVRVLNISSSK